jgi:hypothetical protein
LATLNDDVLERLRELNNLRDRANELREHGREAMAKIPSTVDPVNLESYDLSNDQWVSGRHPVDLALLVRLLNNQGLRGHEFEPCCDTLLQRLKEVIERPFARDGAAETTKKTNDSSQNQKVADQRNDFNKRTQPNKMTSDAVPVLTAARAMHALVGKSETVFSTATMLCYYQIVRELYLATFPNWIIGAARAGEGGRVSAFVTGECVRAVLAFQNSIRDTITFFKTTKKLYEELERLEAIPKVDDYLKTNDGESHWPKCFEIEVERIVLDWYAANNLRRNTIALNLWLSDAEVKNETVSANPECELPQASPMAKSTTAGDTTKKMKDSVLRLEGDKIELESIKLMLKNLPSALRRATDHAIEEIDEAMKRIVWSRETEAGRLKVSDIRNLSFVVQMLVENRNDEYDYYLKALSDPTRKKLQEYYDNEKAGQNRSAEVDRVREDELKAALVKDFNQDFSTHLVARTSDWEKLQKRAEEQPTEKFFKETEWLVEKHLLVIKLIKLIKERQKWKGANELIQLNRIFLEDSFCEKTDDPTTSAFIRVDRRRFEATSSAHAIALRVVGEALDEAQRAAETMDEKKNGHDDLPALLDQFIKQYGEIYRRIGRVIGPAKRYIQDVLNRELAHAANSAKFDAGELLFAAASFGAITKWKHNEQLTEARKLLVDLLPEDGRFQTSRPIQSTAQGLQLMPIAFEMTRCFAQLMRKDFGEDLDPNVVRKLLNLFEENPIELAPGIDDRIGWNFTGAPESQKPSVWVTAVGVFALDRTIRMLNERINAIVLRHFNVEFPKADNDPWTDASEAGGKMNLSKLMTTDYELQSAFKPNPIFEELYRKTRHRMDNVSLPIRLQQMRAHITRAVLPDHYSRKSKVEDYKKAFNALFYGPPGTGKTTLAEALATTARVPLVRLSPSDLMVQGSDVIESRARAIFDSLSMLTQAVIFLDEFEPVVRAREPYSEPAKESIDAPPKIPVTPQDPPEFRFLVTGMLPKLTKLNDVASVQSVVYLLATNYLVEIDDAAKRAKRFDLHLPIYNPDPMSRLLALFYQLIAVLKDEPKIWKTCGEDLEKNPQSFDKLKETLRKQVPSEWAELEKHANDPDFLDRVKRLVKAQANITWQERLRQLEQDANFWTRVHEAITETREVSAQSLATVFFSRKAETNFVSYVRHGAQSDRPGKPTPDQATTGDKKTPVEGDIQTQRERYEDSWQARQVRRPSPQGP